MSIELQNIDCNCNNCIFMIRDIEKYNESLKSHYKWQFDHFTTLKNKLIKKAQWYKETFYDLENWDRLLTQSEKMTFQFNKNEAMINYGRCSKLNKEVSFIPNTIQIETQECFVNRKNAEVLK